MKGQVTITYEIELPSLNDAEEHTLDYIEEHTLECLLLPKLKAIFDRYDSNECLCTFLPKNGVKVKCSIERSSLVS